MNAGRLTVLLTRPQRQQEPLRTLFQEAGATVLSQPTIEIRPPQSWTQIDPVLQRLGSFDWLVFASSNGVEFFLDRISTVISLPTTKMPKICAIGTGTAAALENRGQNVHLIPMPHTAEGVVAALSSEVRGGKKTLLIRASRGRTLMFDELSAASPHSDGVEEIAVYESVDIEKPAPEIASLLESGEIDWTTCTSSAIAASLVRMFGESLRKTKLVSISPITTQTVRNLGFDVAAESQDATMPGIFHAVCSFR